MLSMSKKALYHISPRDAIIYAKSYMQAPQFSQVLPPLPDTPRGISETPMVRVLARGLLRSSRFALTRPDAFGWVIRDS